MQKSDLTFKINISTAFDVARKLELEFAEKNNFDAADAFKKISYILETQKQKSTGIEKSREHFVSIRDFKSAIKHSNEQIELLIKSLDESVQKPAAVPPLPPATVHHGRTPPEPDTQLLLHQKKYQIMINRFMNFMILDKI